MTREDELWVSLEGQRAVHCDSAMIGELKGQCGRRPSRRTTPTYIRSEESVALLFFINTPILKHLLSSQTYIHIYHQPDIILVLQSCHDLQSRGTNTQRHTQRHTRTMAPPVFCCQCGDGPHNIAVAVACTGCGHRLCVSCRPTTEYWAHGNVAALPTQQLTSYASGYSIHDTNSCNGHSHQTAPTSNASFSEDSNSLYSAPYQHPQYPPNLCWLCCKCGSANSVKIDQGCANCCNHWQGSCCVVYEQ